jgi:ankyrin repeat protein
MSSNNAFNTSAALPSPKPGELVKAAIKNDTEAVRDLLERGAYVNERGTLGDTALIWAAWRENNESVRLLLAHGADIDAKNELNMTAMDYVMRDNKWEIAEILAAAAEQRVAEKKQEQVRDEVAEKNRALHDTAARRQEFLKSRARQFTIKPA